MPLIDRAVHRSVVRVGISDRGLWFGQVVSKESTFERFKKFKFKFKYKFKFQFTADE